MSSAVARGEASIESLRKLLSDYAQALQPWAERTAWRMLLDVNAKSLDTWRALGSQISFGLKRELERSPVGARMRELLAAETLRIQSIPQDMADRASKLAQRFLTSGERSRIIAQEIARTGEVAESKAIMLARTGVATAATTLVQARAENIGSTAYVWETSRDGSVRPSHRAMQGQVVHWRSPPTLDGYTAHAGQFANCRCWPRPVIDLARGS